MTQMNYYSLREQSPPVTLEQALMHGLAPDGGLYFPERLPRFTTEEIEQLRGRRERLGPDDQRGFLQEVGYQVLLKWFGQEIERTALREIVIGAQSFPVPIREVGEFQMLELFHGPTMAFKDVAARYLARLMAYFLRKRGEQALLLVATSGDTGGAIAHGFSDIDNIQVVVLFPKSKVSKLQEEQLTRVADNVVPVEVDGVFDDCQALVKQAFVHPRLQHLNLTSANSINIGRLIPQIIYYVYAYFQLGHSDLEIVVPSGNFGNLTAGLFAREMGVPLPRFIAATNRNDAVVRYYQSGVYDPSATVQTLSTAMDVGAPSNFARILELFNHDLERFRRVLSAFSIDDSETVRTIHHVQERYGYLLCPHSAVGWGVAARHGNPELKQLVLATASPLKFADELRAAAGIAVDDSEEIQHLQTRPKRKVSIPNRIEALAELLLS
ncbi:MAG: threonine synthase [Chloroflexota bacterium]|nr:threonine synthase [Chloroflexota bacterium]